jgi:hypothetical protein
VQDDARYGWGKRPYSWELSVSAQHELGRGKSVYGGVFKRWFGNFLVTDDTSHAASDFTPYSVTTSLIPPAPSSSGGQQLPSDINSSGYFNINDTRPATPLTGLSDTMFTGTMSRHWLGRHRHQRPPRADHLPGCAERRRPITDYATPRSEGPAGNKAPVEMLRRGVPAVPTRWTRHMEQQWLPGEAPVVHVPKIDVQLGASYQSIPGIEYGATYAAPNTDLARPVGSGGLGRLPTSGTTIGTTSVGLVQPGSLYGERFNQIDLRMGKILRFGHTRSNISLDIFNILNSDVISGASAIYATWLAPNSVVAPRLFKVSATFDF